MLQTTKLAKGRGSRRRMKTRTAGSSRNERITAISRVMRNTLPKYNSAMMVPVAMMVSAALPDLREGELGARTATEFLGAAGQRLLQPSVALAVAARYS